MVRAFIAVDVFQQARDSLAEVTRSLREAGVSQVRWARPEGIHLTLKFLGEIDPNLVDSVLGAMDRAIVGSAPFTLALSGIGAFPNLNAPRVVWVGLNGDLDALRMLQERIDEEVHLAIGFPKEARVFTPHLTLGRMRDNISGEERRRAGKAMTGVDWEAAVSWQVNEVHLMRSTLAPSGAVYDVLGASTAGGIVAWGDKEQDSPTDWASEMLRGKSITSHPVGKELFKAAGLGSLNRY